jgi:hypothetical protein
MVGAPLAFAAEGAYLALASALTDIRVVQPAGEE